MKAVTLDFKKPGDKIYALGLTRDELGASEYYHLLGAVGNNVPKVDASANLTLYRQLAEAIQEGLLRSVHDCSDGGFWVALAESCMAGRLGCSADLSLLPQEKNLSDAALLFSESQGRFIVSVSPEKAPAFESLLRGCQATCIGEVVSGNRIETTRSGIKVVETSIEEALQHWQRPLNF